MREKENKQTKQMEKEKKNKHIVVHRKTFRYDF